MLTLEMPAATSPAAADAVVDTFQQFSESNYCINPACEAVIPIYNVMHEYSANGLHRTTTAVCAHCKRRHTAQSVLEAGIWRVKGVFFDDPKPREDLIERIDQTQELEHDKELLARAIARMDATVAKARAALSEGRPLSEDDRQQLEQLDTDCDVSAPAISPGPLGEQTLGGYRDQASKLRELSYSDEDLAAPPKDLSVRGDVPFGE